MLDVAAALGDVELALEEVDGATELELDGAAEDELTVAAVVLATLLMALEEAEDEDRGRESESEDNGEVNEDNEAVTLESTDETADTAVDTGLSMD